MKIGRYANVALLAAAMIPLLYVVAYLCLVQVETYGFGDQIRPRYLIAGEAPAMFFAPIHAADEFLRPAMWNEEVVVYD